MAFELSDSAKRDQCFILANGFSFEVHELPSSIEALPCYDWPGNVRELENFIQRTVHICDREEIKPALRKQISTWPKQQKS